MAHDGRANYIPSPLHLLRLRTFGEFVEATIGETPYLVGSVLERPDYRDVDVRILLDDMVFARMFGDEGLWLENGALALANMALSALAGEMSGLTVDCQIQRRSDANAEEHGQRHALLMMYPFQYNADGEKRR